MTTLMRFFGTALVALFLMTGCEEGPMENAGEEVDRAIEDTGESLEETGEEAEDSVD